METRKLGRTGLAVSVIGLGTEHLIDTRQNMDAVLDLAVHAGVNYVDVVYNDPVDDHVGYWEAIGPALRRHRDDLVLCLKWAFIFHEPLDRCQRFFEESLGRLGNGYAEIPMPGLVDTQALWEGWVRESIERLHTYRRDGRIGYIGISSHTPAQCLHHVLSQPVATAVPGPRDLGQMRQAPTYLEASPAEKRATPLHEELKEWLQGQCVLCKHCLPCPQDIPIPDVIYLLDYVEYFGLTPLHQKLNREWYLSLQAKGSDCIECEECLEHCPFGVDIIGKMRRAAEVMEDIA